MHVHVSSVRCEGGEKLLSKTYVRGLAQTKISYEKAAAQQFSLLIELEGTTFCANFTNSSLTRLLSWWAIAWQKRQGTSLKSLQLCTFTKPSPVLALFPRTGKPIRRFVCIFRLLAFWVALSSSPSSLEAGEEYFNASHKVHSLLSEKTWVAFSRF